MPRPYFSIIIAINLQVMLILVQRQQLASALNNCCHRMKPVRPNTTANMPGSFVIARELVQQSIADMDLDPADMSEVEEAFIDAGLL